MIQFDEADDIITAVTANTGVDKREIMGGSRQRHICHARHLAMYMVSIGTGKSSTQIGKLFNRDHSSVLFGIKRITGMIADGRLKLPGELLTFVDNLREGRMANLEARLIADKLILAMAQKMAQSYEADPLAFFARFVAAENGIARDV